MSAHVAPISSHESPKIKCEKMARQGSPIKERKQESEGKKGSEEKNENKKRDEKRGRIGGKKSLPFLFGVDILSLVC